MDPSIAGPAGARTVRRRHLAALFADRERAERAIRALQDLGVPRDRIGVALRDPEAARGLAHAEGATLMAEGATTGAVSGGVLVGLVGLLVGVGALAIPGIGPVVAGGTLGAVLGVAGGSAAAGAGIGAAAGGLIGALVGVGVPEEAAQHFERGVQAGGVLVTLDAEDRVAEARAVLVAEGGDLGPDPDTPGAAGARAATGEWTGANDRRRAGRGRRRTDHEQTTTIL